jgi:predicted nucleic acid-binding protein
VIDSSVAAKWVLPEADGPQAKALMRNAVVTQQRLIVLDLALAEVANAIWKRFHQKISTVDEARQALVDLGHCPVQIAPAAPLLAPALELAIKYACAVYDALFVALVQDLGIPGVTADEPLHRNVHADFPGITLLRDWPAAPPKP